MIYFHGLGGVVDTTKAISERAFIDLTIGIGVDFQQRYQRELASAHPGMRELKRFTVSGLITEHENVEVDAPRSLAKLRECIH
jgi:hypothetical protein